MCTLYTKISKHKIRGDQLKLYGLNGQILRVDLSSGKISVEKPETNFYRRYFGGWGFIAYYLLKELKPGVDPLGSDNKLIFATGVITGSPVPGSGRSSVGAKSPLTGGFGAAETGGFWGVELKHAGFDAVIIEGKAEKPVYLWIHDGEAEIKSASHLWGKDTGESQAMIRKELGDDGIRVAQIGLAGENLVRYACVINDLRDAAGRTGMGAVMGSKKLKAIAVRGHNRVKTVDSEKLKELAKSVTDVFKHWRFPKLGTGGDMYDAYPEAGNLPTSNFRDGNFPHAKDISAQTIEKTIRARMEGCWGCPMQCKKVLKPINKPWTIDPQYGGPEYETLAAFGSNCGVSDLIAICKADELCKRYSLDTISTGCTIAFAMECFEKGLLTEEDTSGIKLNFGNSEAIVKMVEMIAKRQGIGDLLAEGSMRAAKKIGKGAQQFAIHVKGQEVPMHDPRAKRTLGLGYAVSPTGADHMHNFHDTGELDSIDWNDAKGLGILERPPLEEFGSDKVRILIYVTDLKILDNCLQMCHFLPYVFHQKTEIVNATTGWNCTDFELMKVGERVFNMARVFNLREGFTEKDDRLPDRFFRPQASGPISKGINPQQLETLKHVYYEMRGWDRQTGIPTRGKLAELDIAWVANELPM